MSDLLSNVVNQFIVTPTGQTGYIGSQGFVFDIIGDEEAMFDSEITDHYVEENYAIQDHVSLRPPKFTLMGYVGELNDIFQNAFLGLLTSVQSMSAVGDYTMQFGAQATQVYNMLASAVSQVGMVVNQAQNVYSTITGSSTTNSRQQIAYNNFVTLWINRTLCTVEMPWATWTKMAIERLNITQKDDNNLVSEFSVTFKQIRTVAAPTASVTYQAGNILNYTAAQAIVAGPVSGQTITVNGQEVDTSLLSQRFPALFGN